jgi:hypothetical protein
MYIVSIFSRFHNRYWRLVAIYNKSALLIFEATRDSRWHCNWGRNTKRWPRIPRRWHA